MGGKYFLGIDIGSYESKGALVDETGALVASDIRPHVMETPRPGWAEHDALGTWWKDFCSLSRSLIGGAGIDAADVAAVGCSTIAPCCLPVDECGEPLGKAILYGVDVRAAEEIRFLEERLGREWILKNCGAPVSSQSAAAKILWIKNHEPGVYARARRFVTGTTFLVARLTGRYVIDRYTAAAWVPAYDLAAQGWRAETDGLCCEADRLAECLWTTDVAGHVTAEASKQTGLAEGTPVIAGTADAAAEAVSAGVFSPGDLLLMYGSSLFFIHVADRLLSDTRLSCGPYLFEGTHCVTAGMSTAGTMTRWFRDNFARDLLREEQAGGDLAYAALAREAEGVKPGSGGLLVLPYLSGERTPVNDPQARGVIFGLNLRHTRAHVYNACLEGVGFGIGRHFDIFSEMGLETKKVMAVGGGTKNARWLQVVSDITGRAQRTVRVPLGAAYGDALLAALGVGHFGSTDDIAGRIQVKDTVRPNPRAVKAYAPYRAMYSELYDRTKELMHSLPGE